VVQLSRPIPILRGNKGVVGMREMLLFISILAATLALIIGAAAV